MPPGRITSTDRKVFPFCLAEDTAGTVHTSNFPILASTDLSKFIRSDQVPKAMDTLKLICKSSFDIHLNFIQKITGQQLSMDYLDFWSRYQGSLIPHYPSTQGWVQNQKKKPLYPLNSKNLHG